MKVAVEESFPGEFESLTDAQKVHKLDESHRQAAHALGVPRGGEIQLIVDLAVELGEKYEARRLRLLSDYADISLEDDDDDQEAT